MSLPIVSSNYFQERAGVMLVAGIINQLNLLFRETTNADVGIDGQIELVNELGEATGRLIAVQIKSGSSYINERNNELVFYPSEKHREYWQNFPIPVFVMIHDPVTNYVYFQDVRQYLSEPGNAESSTILIKKVNILSEATKYEL